MNTELDKLVRAKKYMELLAEGIDPITETELPGDSCLNNIRLARCFFYISDILGKLIENNGIIGKRPTVKKEEFVVTEALLQHLPTPNKALQISMFVAPMNDFAEQNNMKKIPVTAFTNWLVDQGYLREEMGFNNKRRKVATASAASIGISEEERVAMHGTYMAILYSPQAQQFLLEHLDEIVAHWKSKKSAGKSDSQHLASPPLPFALSSEDIPDLSPDHFLNASPDHFPDLLSDHITDLSSEQS